MVEHRLARLVQLGIRQARYFGRAKTKFQLYLAATVANLTLVAAKAGLPANTGGSYGVGSALRTGTIRSAFDFVPVGIAQILTLALFTSASLPKYISPSTRLSGQISRTEWRNCDGMDYEGRVVHTLQANGTRTGMAGCKEGPDAGENVRGQPPFRRPLTPTRSVDSSLC